MSRVLLDGLVSAVDLMAMTFPPQTARELVASGECSPMCMLAIGEDVADCECSCNGAYHAMLLDAVVETWEEARTRQRRG